MAAIGNDITRFNGYVKGLVQSLAARGERTEDLLSNLFKGYQAVADKNFLKYVNSKQEKYEEGKRYTPDQLMQLADNKFRLLKEKGIWDTPSESEKKDNGFGGKVGGTSEVHQAKGRGKTQEG